MNGISSDTVGYAARTGNDIIAVSGDYATRFDIHWLSNVILTCAPGTEEFVAVKECDDMLHAVFTVSVSKPTAVFLCKLGNKVKIRLFIGASSYSTMRIFLFPPPRFRAELPFSPQWTNKYPWYSAWHIILCPRAFFVQLRNNKPSQKFLKPYGKRFFVRFFNSIFRQIFGKDFHNISSSYFGVMWIKFFKIGFCSMQAAFHCANGDA